MNSLKKLRMNKFNLFSSKKDLEKAFSSLEEKTSVSYHAFAISRQKVQEIAQSIHLD